MGHLKLICTCLTVAVAMCALGAATASAGTPTFTFSGETNALSSKGGTLSLETTKGEVVKCESITTTGTIESPSASNEIKAFAPIFKGCDVKILGKEYKCKSTGAEDGEIKGFSLHARLGWLSESKEEAGLLFSPEEGLEGNPHNLIAEFACTKGAEKIEVKLKGSVIGKITPVNTSVGPAEATKDFEVKLTKGSAKGEQGIKNFEGEAENKLEMEDSITEKEGKGFVQSATEVPFEIFPEMTSQIIPAIVQAVRTGGAGGVGELMRCKFTLTRESCTIEVKNISTTEEEVTVSEITSGNATKFGFRNNGCTVETKLKIPPALGCTVEVWATEIGTWVSVYYVKVRQIAAPNRQEGTSVSLAI